MAACTPSALEALKVKSYINTAGDMDVSVHPSYFCGHKRTCAVESESQYSADCKDQAI